MPVKVTRWFTSADGEMTATIHVTEQMKNEVFNRVLRWFAYHEVWSGESVVQNDAPCIDAPQFLADLVDEVICPEVEYR